jgi:hypothetical protein
MTGSQISRKIRGRKTKIRKTGYYKMEHDFGIKSQEKYTARIFLAENYGEGNAFLAYRAIN